MSASSRRALLIVLLGILPAAGCGAPTAVDGFASLSCTSWKEEIGPLLSARCAACHSTAKPAGAFDATSYLSVIGTPAPASLATQSTPLPAWARAGDATSPLLGVLSPASADAIHQPVSDTYAQVRAWVVDCRVSYVRTEAHGGGILDPGDTGQFHGAILRNAGWNFASCAPCHGKDLAGGASGSSCFTCHQAGPTTCDTCHGGLSTGAHRDHIRGTTQGKPLLCSECHVQPTDYRDVGHLFAADGSVISGPAPVVFGPLAAATPAGTMRAAAPTWQRDAGNCQNVYCHGAVFVDSQATLTQPDWTANPKEAACGTCHGLPPQSHSLGQTRCFLCHDRTVDENRALRPGGLHLNGKVDVGNGSGTCSACHGGGDGTGISPAPPVDLLLHVESTSLGVGAHQAHLAAGHRLRGPIDCTECHVVPQKLDSPGHIDDALPAPVFPVGAGVLARADGATPTWDHAAARCADNYCHGGGKMMAGDLTVGLLRKPVWTLAGQASCGTCHGIPPTDAAHTPNMTLLDCQKCHPSTMDATGAIVLTGPKGAETSTHINGVVDVVK